MKKSLLLTWAAILIVSVLKAQTPGDFGNAVTSGSAKWIVSKYLNTSTGEEKKALFNNYTFQFYNGDSAYVMVADVTGSKSPRKGFWNEDAGEMINFSLPSDPYDNPYYQITLLLNRTALEKASITSSKIDLKTPGVMEDIVIEFTKQ